jgi:signal transduction histidine kinase
VSLFVETLRALAHPRRAVPIAVVSAPMVFAQWHFSGRNPVLVGLAVGMVALFVLTGPFAWRWLFPPSPLRWDAPLRLLVYGFVGALPAAFGRAAPDLVGFYDSFLTSDVSTPVVAAMFWVGGWGLARDVDLELGFQRERRRAERLAREAERAQLLALKAHLDPHFLFNTLNAIAEWCQQDPAVAERAILELSGILREVLGGISAPSWSLGRELDLARDVWSLHRMRDPSWFTVDWEVEDGLHDVPVPPMVLLPVVENAVKHGPARGHRGVLALRVSSRGDGVTIEVSNPGSFSGPRAGGNGLSLVSRRLAMSYGAAASFDVGSAEGRVRATIRVPRSGPVEA